MSETEPAPLSHPDKPGLLAGWADEIDPLCVLIYLRLLGREADPGFDVRNEDQVEAVRREVPAGQREFVDQRVAGRLRWYVKTVNRLNFTRFVVSGTVAGGGLLVSGITAIHQTPSNGLSWENYVVIGLGVIVGVLGAVGPRVARGEQVERYRRGSNELRLEAWRFATNRGHYAEIDNLQEAFNAFVDAVEAIENEAIATELDISQEK